MRYKPRPSGAPLVHQQETWGCAQSQGNSVVVQSLSCVRLFRTPWTAAHQASLLFTIFRSLLKLMSIESVMLSNHLILCHPLLLLPSIFPSFRVFSNESALRIKGQNTGASASVLSVTFSRLLSLRIDWFDLLAVQGSLKSLLQHGNSQATILWLSAFFMVVNKY